MDFAIKFLSTNGHAVQIARKGVGLAHLDNVRKQLNLPQLPAELVRAHVSHMEKCPRVVITEAQARASGRFLDKSDVTVQVPKGALNAFCSLGTVADTNPDGKVTDTFTSQKLDESAVIEAWAAAGYPLEWKLAADL